MPPEGLDEAREAFAADIAPAAPPRPRDDAGRFTATNAKPEPIFQPRPVEGDDSGDTRDGGPDPRLVERERRAADGWFDEGDEGRRQGPRRDGAQHPDAAPDAQHGAAEGERQEPGGQDADAAGQDDEGADEGSRPEGDAEPDAGPRYKVQVDGAEREVSLNEALKGYVSGETFNARMGQLTEVAKAIDQRGTEAAQARDAYIEMCRRQEQEFAALIPQAPTQAEWDRMYAQSPQQAHALESNFRHVYGTLNEIRQRRVQAEQSAYQDHARRTAEYSQTEFTKFKSRNKLSDQASVDKAVGFMRRTALAHGFSEDEIGSTYDERMLSILLKAARYDNMMANKPLPVQPDRGQALQPGSAPRVGDAGGRRMNDAQKRLAASGRIDDAAAVMAQLIRR